MSASAYEPIAAGAVLWEVDGRRGRNAALTYRESRHATYTFPNGKTTAWDGLVSNHPGMVGFDPVRGIDLTMPAGEARAGGYTTRDVASAPHGVDYRPHYEEWAQDRDAHPNLVFPGRAAVWQGVRFDCLALGEELTGTGGCALQDWVGLDLDTIERTGSASKESEFSGFGVSWLPRRSMLPRLWRATGMLRRRPPGPLATPIEGVAPLHVMMARVRGFLVSDIAYVDPSVPHEVAMAWTGDGEALDAYIDGTHVLRVQQGARAIPAGARTRGRVRFHRSGFHAVNWNDNGSGNPDVKGTAGHADRDEVFTVERVAIVALEEGAE
jgi:hypothetical protein